MESRLLVQRRPVVHLLGSAVRAAVVTGRVCTLSARSSSVGQHSRRARRRTCNCAALSCAERSAPQSRPPALRRGRTRKPHRRAPGWSAARLAPPSLKSRAMFFFGRDSGMSSTCGGERAAGVTRRAQAPGPKTTHPLIKRVELVLRNEVHHSRQQPPGPPGAACARRGARRRKAAWPDERRCAASVPWLARWRKARQSREACKCGR